MSVSLVAVFDKKIGKRTGEYPALGNGLAQIDKLLTRSKLPVMGQFVSMDPEEWKDMDPDDPDAEALPDLQWFKPSDGLNVIDAAVGRLQAQPKLLSWSADALAELARLRAELDAANKKKARFRFEICD